MGIPPPVNLMVARARCRFAAVYGSRVTRHVCHAALLASLAGPLPPVSAALTAQQSVRGIVVRAGTEQPIERAAIYLVGATGAVRGVTSSDSAGSFVVWAPDPGIYTLHIHRPGYMPTRSDSLEVQPQQSIQVRVSLMPDAVMLEAITVFGEPPPSLTPELEQFLARRRMRMGYNFSREDIARLKADHVVDLLREVPGFVTLSSRASSRRYVLNANRCTPAIFIDGRRSLLPETELLEFQSLHQVYGIEVFRYASSAPAVYASGCGSILIWTRPPGP